MARRSARLAKKKEDEEELAAAAAAADSGSEEEAPPKRGRRTRAGRKAPPSRRKAAASDVDDEEEEKKPKRRSGRSRRAAAASDADDSDGDAEDSPKKPTRRRAKAASRTTRGKRGAAKKKEASDDEEEEEEEEEEKKPTRRRSGRKRGVAEAVEDEDDEDEALPAAKRARRTRKPSAAAAAAAAAAAVAADDEDEEEEKASPAARKGRGGRKTKAKAKAAPARAKSAAARADAGEEEEKKEVKVISKGGAAVDPGCRLASSTHVYKGACARHYTASLNQTSISAGGRGSNKFYVLQVLESDAGGSFYAYFKWGRVGGTPKDKLEGPFSSAQPAIAHFTKKFDDKTRNYWTVYAATGNFTKYPKKYDIIETDMSGGGGGDDGDDDDDDERKESAESALDERQQALIAMISNKKRMKARMAEMKLNVNKMPLGKLSKKQVERGYEALRAIGAALDNDASRAELVELCNTFYTRIPHDYGYSSPPLISDPKMLKKKIELLDTLRDIEVAQRLLKSAAKAETVHPLDSAYDSLQCQLTPLNRKGKEYRMVKRYLETTHAPTHTQFDLELLDVFEIKREGERERYEADGWHEVHNKRLLWHGSRLSNFMGILSQGLRIAPPEAPVTGYMFGKGVYLADLVSKSAQYCRTSREQPEGLLILVESALGDESRKLRADSSLSGAKIAPAHSVKGCGKTVPAGWDELDDGVSYPLGPPTPTDDASVVRGSSLRYNEYIAYKESQCVMRYLLRVRFKWKNWRRYW